MSTFRRPIDNAESLRSTRRSLGDGTVTGRSRLAMPPQNKARGTGLQRLSGPVEVGGVSTGETITVRADDVAVSATPSTVTFTTEVGERAGFFFAPPSDAIGPTFGDAYYDVYVSIDRGGYDGTLAVEVLRGDEVVWGPTVDPYWSNPSVPVVAKGRLVDPAISPWRVRLTGSEAGTVASVVAQVELVDRPRITPDVIPDPVTTKLGYGLNASSNTGTPAVTLNAGLLTEVEEGDVLLFGFQWAGVYISGTPAPSPASPAGLALLHEFPHSASAGSGRRTGGRFLWRRATADDLNGVNTYQFSWGPNSSNSIIWIEATLMAISGLGVAGNPFGSKQDVWYEGSAGNPPGTLTVAAPGGARTLVGSMAVRNVLTVPTIGNYEQTPQTPGLDPRYFWISDSVVAPTTGQFFGFDGSIGDLGGNRRGGMHRVLTADANTGAQVRYGESLTHAGLVAIAINE